MAITGVAYGTPVTLKPDAMPREFGAALAAVTDLQTRLQESETTRKRLLANLVHELGRPLGALQAAIHALRQGADQDPALRDELLQGMDLQVERLKPLLDNLASLHGGLSGALELQQAPVNLNEWLPKTIVTWREAAEQKGLVWLQEIPSSLPVVNLDANRMAQALGNLLSNAIKYTPEGGTITVSAGEHARHVWIAVQDTGMGISPEDQQHIFDPLYRGNPAAESATNRFPQGRGLGLSIARDVVTAHGGSIRVESMLREGSRFTIILPA
jgi:signal transduction histidine kinase